MVELNEDNFMLYAAKAYQKLNPTMAEMEGDLQRIQYIKRLLTKYHENGDLKPRLVLNHLQIFYNVFGPEAATQMLFFKMDRIDLKVLKPFLLQLSVLPIRVRIRGQTLNTDEIQMDQNAVDFLRTLK